MREQIHEGFARRIEARNLGALNVLGLICTGRADLDGKALVLQVVERLELFCVRAMDQHRETGRVVGRRKVNALLAFRRDGNAGSNHINIARHQSRDQCVKAHVENLHVKACFLTHCTDEVHVKARVVLRLRVEEFKRRKGGFRADAKQVAGLSRGGPDCKSGGSACAEDDFLELHDECLLF